MGFHCGVQTVKVVEDFQTVAVVHFSFVTCISEGGDVRLCRRAVTVNMASNWVQWRTLEGVPV